MKSFLRPILKNHEADMNAILTGIVIAITLAISVVIVWNVLATVDTDTIDAEFAGTPAANATENLNTNLETFYTVMPIVLIVIAAVAILGYVLLLRRE